MVNSKKLYYYATISLLLNIVLATVIYKALLQANEADYKSLSIAFGLIETFLGVIFVTAISVFFQRDKFLKSRTLFIYIFCGFLNLSVAGVFLVFMYSNLTHKSLSASLSLPLLLIGTNIIWNIFP